MGTFRVCPAQVTIAYRQSIINLERWALMEDFVLAEVFVDKKDADAALLVAQAELEESSSPIVGHESLEDGVRR